MRRPMKKTPDQPRINAFVDVRCLCGQLHTFLRDKVVEELGVGRWKCGGCKRRFILACVPQCEGHPEAFWPVFLENVPSTGSTVKDGTTIDPDSTPSPTEELQFRCRCGCRLVARSPYFGKPLRCPRCASTVVVRLGYAPDTGKPSPLLEYPGEGTEAPRK
jgi:hypothetical protein